MLDVMSKKSFTEGVNSTGKSKNKKWHKLAMIIYYFL